MGKPLITGDSPAIREVLNDRKNAVLCEMGNPQSLAGSILSLKNNVEFKTKIEKNGYRKFNENFTSEVLGKDLKIKLERLVGDN